MLRLNVSAIQGARVHWFYLELSCNKLEMSESSYSLGGLSELIATKSNKKKPTSKAKTLISKDKLKGVFDDPSAVNYALKPTPVVSRKKTSYIYVTFLL